MSETIESEDKNVRSPQLYVVLDNRLQPRRGAVQSNPNFQLALMIGSQHSDVLLVFTICILPGPEEWSAQPLSLIWSLVLGLRDDLDR